MLPRYQNQSHPYWQASKHYRVHNPKNGSCNKKGLADCVTKNKAPESRTQSLREIHQHRVQSRMYRSNYIQKTDIPRVQANRDSVKLNKNKR